MADDLTSLLAQLGIGPSSGGGAPTVMWRNGQMVDANGNPLPTVDMTTQGMQPGPWSGGASQAYGGLPSQLPMAQSLPQLRTPPADGADPSSANQGVAAPVTQPSSGGSIWSTISNGIKGLGSGLNHALSVDPSTLPQRTDAAGPSNGQGQSTDGGVIGEVGNVLLTPLHILNAMSTAYGNTPRVIAQANRSRDLAIQAAALNLSRTKALIALGSQAAADLQDDGSGAPPSGSQPQGGQAPADASGSTPPILQRLAPFMTQPPADQTQTAPSGATRGLRNNNPGNVRSLPNGQQWQGQTGVDPDGYATFGNMQDGIRATLTNLHSYGARDGLNTLQAVINRWSPGAPPGYAVYVAHQMGVKATDKIDLSDPNTLRGVAQGMFAFENGPQAWQAYQNGGDRSQTASLASVAPATGDTGPAGLPQPSLAAQMAARYPQDGQPAPRTIGLSSNARRGLATLALMSGQADQAASIMSGDVATDSNGNMFDKKTGAILGHAPAASYVNGFRTDPNAPGAPDYIPKLPDGTMPDGRGGVISIPGAVGAARAASFADQAGKNDANWPGDNLTVTGPDGRPYTMSRSQFAAMTGGQGNQGGPGPRGGVGAGGNGQGGGLPGIPGVSGGQDEFTKDQAKDASDTLSGDMNARSEALQDLDNSRQALSYVQSHGNAMNPSLPFIVAGQNYLRALPPDALKAVGVDPSKPAQSANDAGVYQRLSSEDLLTFSKGHLPSRYTEREMAVAARVIPQLSTAPDAATFHWGLAAAIANKTLQRADFASNYQGNPSRQAVEQQWNTTPGGQASLFEDPVWQGLKIGGKPAVVYTSDPRTGRTVGVVGMGTSAPVTFYPSGAR